MPGLRVVSREKLADTETPVSAYIKLCRDRSDSFLMWLQRARASLDFSVCFSAGRSMGTRFFTISALFAGIFNQGHITRSVIEEQIQIDDFRRWCQVCTG